MSLIWKGDFAGLPGKVVLANPMVCTNTAKGDNKLYSDAKGVVPSLDVRFASQKNLNDYMTGTPLVDHQRSMFGSNLSPGTYVGSDGLIKTATTNLLLRSEEFDQWGITGPAGIIANQATAPNGSLTADEYAYISGSGVPYLTYTAGSLDTPKQLSISIYVKNNNASSMTIRLREGSGVTHNTRLNYSFVANTVSTIDAGAFTSSSPASIPLGDGWHRISCIIDVDTSILPSYSSVRYEIYYQFSNVSSDLGSFYLWGAQLEQSSTVGEYVKTTDLPSAAPRFDYDPTTGESLGLLIEESRTNILFNSATLSTQSVTTSATAYTLSFYGTGTVTLSGTSTAGPLVGTGANDRVTLTFTPTAGTLTLTVTGTVSNAQLEVGSFPTSYIPTTGTALTRSADVANITGANFSSWYNQSEGTFFFSAKQPIAYANPAIGIGIGGGAIYQASNTLADWWSGSDLLFSISAGSGGWTTGAKIAAAYTPSNRYACFNSGLVRSNTSSLANGGKLEIGRQYGGLGAKKVTIARLTYFPDRLPDATLQAITAP